MKISSRAAAERSGGQRHGTNGVSVYERDHHTAEKLDEEPDDDDGYKVSSIYFEAQAG